MGHSRSPLRYMNEADVAHASRNAFNGLPLHIMNQLLSAGNPEADSPAGLLGIPFYFNHFYQWEGPVTATSAGGWTLTSVTGTGTIVRTNTREGNIVLTADATGSCNPTLQLGSATLGANFLYKVGKRIWVFARLKMGTVASTEFFFGLGLPDTQPTVTNTFPADGIFFHKTTTATKLSFDVRASGTSTSKALITGTLVDDTYRTIGFQVEAAGNVIPYDNGTALTASAVAAGNANLPATTSALQLMVAFLGASQTVTLDWLLAAQEI